MKCWDKILTQKQKQCMGVQNQKSHLDISQVECQINVVHVIQEGAISSLSNESE